MNPPFDAVVVGAGLAGACAAHALSRHGRVLVLDAAQPASGASGAAAGLVNPMMGRKASLGWEAPAALDALHALLSEAGAAALLRATGILRPAADARQAAAFRDAALRHPEYGTWLPAGAARERVPGLVLHEGALLVAQGGALAVPAFVEAVLASALRQGTRVRTGAPVVDFGEEDAGAFVSVGGGERIEARRVVLAMGYGYWRFETLRACALHSVKGQVVRVARPEGLRMPLPVAGSGYAVPDGAAVVVGSTYERGFSSVAPSAAQTRAILMKAGQMLPALAGARVLEARAGVRVTVPGTRLPMLGPLPGHARVWIFTGLGSKGLLMAPLLARRLPSYLADPTTIPPVLAVR